MIYAKRDISKKLSEVIDRFDALKVENYRIFRWEYIEKLDERAVIEFKFGTKCDFRKIIISTLCNVIFWAIGGEGHYDDDDNVTAMDSIYVSGDNPTLAMHIDICNFIIFDTAKSSNEKNIGFTETLKTAMDLILEYLSINKVRVLPEGERRNAKKFSDGVL